MRETRRDASGSGKTRLRMLDVSENDWESEIGI